MGLLAVDVFAHGAVMSADSQPVELLDGETRVLKTSGPLTRDPILVREGGGFTGLVGYVGAEKIDGMDTRSWLQAFDANHATAPLGEYADALADSLSETWQRAGIKSVLEILITGVEGDEVRFWYVRNSQGLYEADWTFKSPAKRFHAVNDLDTNYVARDLEPGQTKDELLETRLYSFRQGVLLPATPVFDSFTGIIGMLYAHGIDGWEPVASLDDLAYVARQRMGSPSASTARSTASTRTRTRRWPARFTYTAWPATARSGRTRRSGARPRRCAPQPVHPRRRQQSG